MKILILSLKNFVKGLKFIFTPIGILSLFLIIALSVAIPTIIESIKTMTDGVAAIFQDYSVNWEDVFIFLLSKIANEDWSQPTETFNMLISQEYLTNTLFASLQVAFPELTVDLNEVGTLIAQAIATILMMVGFVFLMILLGFAVGFFVTRWFVKDSLRHRKIWQRVVFGLFDALVSIFVVWLCIRCLPLGYWGIPILLLIFIGQAALCLFESWFIYAFKKLRIRDIFNIKNIGFLLLSNILIIIGCVLIVVPFVFTKLIPVIVILGLSVFIVGQAVVKVNAEAYVAYITDESNMYKEAKKKEIKTANKEKRQAKKAERAKRKEAKANAK